MGWVGNQWPRGVPMRLGAHCHHNLMHSIDAVRALLSQSRSRLILVTTIFIVFVVFFASLVRCWPFSFTMRYVFLVAVGVTTRTRHIDTTTAAPRRVRTWTWATHGHAPQWHPGMATPATRALPSHVHSIDTADTSNARPAAQHKAQWASQLTGSPQSLL